MRRTDIDIGTRPKLITFGEAEVYLYYRWRRGVVEGDVTPLQLGPIDLFGGRKKFSETKKPEIAQRRCGPIELPVCVIALGPVFLQAPQDSGSDWEANLLRLARCGQNAPDARLYSVQPGHGGLCARVRKPQRDLHASHGGEVGSYGLEG